MQSLFFLYESSFYTQFGWTSVSQGLNYAWPFCKVYLRQACLLCSCFYFAIRYRKRWFCLYVYEGLCQSSTTVLGAFAKLRKAATSIVMSVCPYGTTRLLLDGFHEIWNFENLARKIHVSLTSDKNNGYFTWRPIYFFHYIFLGSS